MSLNINNIQTLFPSNKAKLLNRHGNELCFKNNLKAWCIRLIDGKWLILVIDTGKVIETQAYDSEYKACLKFLYLCRIITTDHPNEPKILHMDRDHCFAEKNGEYILDTRVMCNTHGEYSWEMELNEEEIKEFEKYGWKFINSLIIQVDSSNPAQKNSKFSQRNKTNWYLSSQELKAWQELQIIEKPIIIEKPTYQEPQKNGIKIIIGFVGLILIFYIIFFLL